MRLVLYLGTRGCRGVLEDALDNYHDPLEILVPADGRLLGETGTQIEDEMVDVSELVARRARERAHEIARREAEQLAGVFGQDPPDPDDRIGANVLEGPIDDALDACLDRVGADEVYVARGVLEIFDEAGLRIDPVLDRHRAELVAR
jgi:hypothetical protein